MRFEELATQPNLGEDLRSLAKEAKERMETVESKAPESISQMAATPLSSADTSFRALGDNWSQLILALWVPLRACVSRKYM